ncbi:MAG: oligosaccharide flippase family protein [Prolixibacteraceae bacterium]
MGIIIKQSLKGGLWTYIGVLIGFVTTSYLYTEYLTPEVVGLFGLLIAISTLTSQLSLLGMGGVTARLFPHFRDPGKEHNGFLFIALVVLTAGFLLFLAAYYTFKGVLIETNLEKSRLFADYVYLLIPLTLFSLIFNFLDTYNKLLYNAVLGTFLQEFLQRSLIFAAVILYIFRLLTLNQLIIAFTTAVCLKGVILFIYLLSRGEIHLLPKPGFIDKKLKKEMLDVALFSIIGGMGAMLVFSIDKIVVNQMLDLKNTGVYTIAFYFGALVIIPSRPLLKISGTLIADAWYRNDLGQIRSIYYKSCINQFIIGGFLFLGIWANIDNILTILGEDYLQSKWVIFFIGSGYLFDMMTGANAQVIAFSKYYRISLLFIVILIGIVLFLLAALIPVWGITGAAVAIAGGLFLNNLMRYIFLYRKYQLQPFNFKFIVIGLFYMLVFFLTNLIQQQELYVDLFLRSILITIFTTLFFWIIPLSEDITIMKNTLVLYLQKKLK